MLAPNQLQDLAVILNTDTESLEEVYNSSDIDITDEMSIIDILSDDIKDIDYKKIRLILQNYPLFDDILLKMNIVEQVQHIDKLSKIHIVEYLTKDVLKSFEGTPLYKVFNESLGDTNESKNENIRKKIMEMITPKSYLKPIMEGISETREKKIFNESLSEYQKNLPEKSLRKEIVELHRFLSKLPYMDSNGDFNPQYVKVEQEIKELEELYDEKFGNLNEDVIEPIKPIKPIEVEEPNDNNSSNNQDKEITNSDEANDELEKVLDSEKDLDPILLTRAFSGMDQKSLEDIYKDMDSDDLQDHLEAIEEYLKDDNN